ncbi:hypothetical protein LJC11_04965 [Bacteroidales bacterium OttesenSCG-928-I21]|nr:hypothetical protein [Bacteroidales bacterium OttesenSCG-928-I21]
MKAIGKILICFVAISFFACSSPETKEYNRLKKYFKKVHSFDINNSIDKIVVIAEGKNCATCDNAFSQEVFKNYQGNDKVVFLITATGKIIDIKPFLDLEKNCYFDWNLNISDYKIFSDSKIIYLGHTKIDSLKTNMEYLSL